MSGEYVKKYSRFVLRCSKCGSVSSEFGQEDAVFLRVDKEKFGVKTPCKQCGGESCVFLKREDVGVPA